jgi:hypothetical protein
MSLVLCFLQFVLPVLLPVVLSKAALQSLEVLRNAGRTRE